MELKLQPHPVAVTSVQYSVNGQRPPGTRQSCLETDCTVNVFFPPQFFGVHLNEMSILSYPYTLGKQAWYIPPILTQQLITLL